ncbi:Eco57I restriction-modification methylase domain-containing protein [Lactococcus lactis]|uniref:Eco57I restriction-modification methylase domain-containing protein n=1 Tax=Lactococcus lactis TaxID=1358 RepID=UPI0021B0821F|nr:N-6 DNA methylase [Lactococcus lactis]
MKSNENSIGRIKRLQSMVDAFEKDIKTYKSNNSVFNEQMTRQQYLDRLLALLGWDITNPHSLSFSEREVVAEEYSNRGDRPDYTIRMNGMSLFFVEAKKVNVDIINEVGPALQARRYGWNAGHKISVLTNFEYLIIYTTFKQPTPDDSVTTERYKIYHYTEYIGNFDEIYDLLSRESILNGEFERWTSDIAPENATKLSLDQVFLEQLNSWRLLIANDLVKNDNYIFDDKNDLNEKVQIFLNQLIFLRFVEDNQFEEHEELKHSIEIHTDYRSYFASLDKKYNAGIFKNPDVIMNISNDTLKQIVENLYFPNVSYDFSIIDLSILSRIYENFLQREVIDAGNGLVLQKTRSAKIKAVISTPDSVVKLMVKEVMAPKIQGLKPDELINLRIADFAVGSGIFLIEAYNFIEEYLVDWYSVEKNSAPNHFLVPFEVKKKIIQNVFRGYDINVLAVQLTRFSMLLRLLSFEKTERIEEIKPILPSLEKTIIWGNTLVDMSDIDITQLTFEAAMDIAPMKEEVDFKNEKFDIILGNPPYMKTEEIKEATQKQELDIYKKKYKSAYKQYDKYFLFIERILSKLKSDGVAELLVPNKFFTVGAAIELRKIIRNMKGLKRVIDFKYTQIFSGVTNYVAIVQLGNYPSSTFDYSVVKSVNEAFQNPRRLKYSFDNLLDSHWFLTDSEQIREQYEFAINNFPNIEEEVRPVNGIQTSANGVYLLKKKFITGEENGLIHFTVTTSKKEESFSIEKELLRDFYKKNPRVRGKSYQTLVADTLVLFPYKGGKLIESPTMISNYPNAFAYLESHKDKLLPKEMGGNRDVPDATEWYQFGRTQFLKESNEDKIIVGVMSNQPNFNIDRTNMLFASGGTAGDIAILMNADSKYELEYIQAWLSHPFTDAIFKVIGSSFEGNFYTHGTDMYDAIPLLPINFMDTKEKKVYNNIIDGVKEIESLNKYLESLKSERKKQFVGAQIDAIIAKIHLAIDDLLQTKVVK